MTEIENQFEKEFRGIPSWGKLLEDPENNREEIQRRERMAQAAGIDVLCQQLEKIENITESGGRKAIERGIASFLLRQVAGGYVALEDLPLFNGYVEMRAAQRAVETPKVELMESGLDKILREAQEKKSPKLELNRGQMQELWNLIAAKLREQKGHAGNFKTDILELRSHVISSLIDTEGTVFRIQICFYGSEISPSIYTSSVPTAFEVANKALEGVLGEKDIQVKVDFSGARQIMDDFVIPVEWGQKKGEEIVSDLDRMPTSEPQVNEDIRQQENGESERELRKAVEEAKEKKSNELVLGVEEMAELWKMTVIEIGKRENKKLTNIYTRVEKGAAIRFHVTSEETGEVTLACYIGERGNWMNEADLHREKGFSTSKDGGEAMSKVLEEMGWKVKVDFGDIRMVNEGKEISIPLKATEEARSDNLFNFGPLEEPILPPSTVEMEKKEAELTEKTKLEIDMGEEVEKREEYVVKMEGMTTTILRKVFLEDVAKKKGEKVAERVEVEESWEKPIAILREMDPESLSADEPFKFFDLEDSLTPQQRKKLEEAVMVSDFEVEEEIRPQWRYIRAYFVQTTKK